MNRLIHAKLLKKVPYLFIFQIELEYVAALSEMINVLGHVNNPNDPNPKLSHDPTNDSKVEGLLSLNTLQLSPNSPNSPNNPNNPNSPNNPNNPNNPNGSNAENPNDLNDPTASAAPNPHHLPCKTDSEVCPPDAARAAERRGGRTVPLAWG